ncbi:transcription factor IIA, alpha/beta subunit-domain-containing protein [Lentinula lateritia]|uniref:Transcription factor IIA, alpha/beta subunit-domain-containing protein n=1 Tax=Lentinula aff. lateritia TaxID=2804960 RepID=A0ACC1U7S4_9AGAR|nr:transcription factor IIA, alpha/beta subunit-domain-containing protein [Lentinula aff. lateritia]KAJ3854850.1 transcription factor IIA, alpha/beta subunit-domain-containing protein [Lentinula lateritia]
MSNKIVPEFEEYGVSEDVLAELQHKWENKVIASHVADFEVVNVPPAQAPHHSYQTHAMHMMQSHPAYTAAAAPHSYVAAAPAQPGVKAEPIDTRYMLHNAPQMAYALPHLPGPAINGARQPAVPQYGSQTSILSFPPGPPPVQSLPTNGAGVPLGRAYVPPTNGTPIATMSAPPAGAPPTSNTGGGGSAGRIPQLDGPSEDESDEDSQTPPPYAPRSTHPSLPQPQASTSASADSEAINSDLDDSDTGDEEEADDGAVGETDIVFCTYDKVARVKNKWKCILKDGMIHVNGKDYLFSKCTGEFEW